MRIHKAERAWEWNLNTVVQLIGLALILLGGGYWLNDQERDIRALNDWRLEHEAEGKERRGANEAAVSRLGAMVSGLDERLDTAEAASVRLSDRVSATEARSAEFATNLRELQRAINEQGSDLRYIRTWIEDQRDEQRQEQR